MEEEKKKVGKPQRPILPVNFFRDVMFQSSLPRKVFQKRLSEVCKREFSDQLLWYYEKGTYKPKGKLLKQLREVLGWKEKRFTTLMIKWKLI
jgi:hypothetical protein